MNVQRIAIRLKTDQGCPPGRRPRFVDFWRRKEEGEIGVQAGDGARQELREKRCRLGQKRQELFLRAFAHP